MNQKRGTKRNRLNRPLRRAKSVTFGMLSCKARLCPEMNCRKKPWLGCNTLFTPHLVWTCINNTWLTPWWLFGSAQRAGFCCGLAPSQESVAVTDEIQSWFILLAGTALDWFSCKLNFALGRVRQTPLHFWRQQMCYAIMVLQLLIDFIFINRAPNELKYYFKCIFIIWKKIQFLLAVHMLVLHILTSIELYYVVQSATLHWECDDF